MSDTKEEIIIPKKSRAKTVVNISAPSRRKAPIKKPRREISIKPPIPLSPKSISKRIGDHLVDNTGSNTRRAPANYKTRHSNFLLTFVPNSSVREDVNPELYKSLKNEIKSFAQYVLDPNNLSDILKAAPGNDDPKWFSKVKGIGDDRVASIEDSKDSNKRLHTHIYIPIEHSTKVQLNLDNIRQIAEVMLEPLGVKGPRIDAKVEKGTSVYSARDYVTKLGNGDNGELINLK